MNNSAIELNNNMMYIMTRPHKETSDEDRARIIRAHEGGSCPKSIASVLSINRTTVIRIVNEYNENGKTQKILRDGQRNQILLEENKTIIRGWIDQSVQFL